MHYNKLKLLILSLILIALSGCSSQKKALEHSPDRYIDEIKIKMKAKAQVISSYEMLNNNSLSLFKGGANIEVGDIITVLLEESMSAKKNAKTSTASDSEGKLDSPVILGLAPKVGGMIAQALGDGTPGDLSFGFGGSQKWSGDGSSSQSNSLKGEISAFVVEILNNGNIRIEGSKKLLINQGEELVVVSGIVRPKDIDSDNTVKSTRIAGANIRYFGDGIIDGANKMGWISKFFNDVGAIF